MWLFSIILLRIIGDDNLILCDSKYRFSFSLWDLMIAMNEKIYFKGFWLIGLGVGGGATCFREWDVKLIQLLISIVLHKLEAAAAGLKATLCKRPYKCTGWQPLLWRTELRNEVSTFFFLCLELKLPSWTAFPVIVCFQPHCSQMRGCVGAVRSLGISLNGRTCPHQVWEPCHSRDCAFVVAGLN